MILAPALDKEPRLQESSHVLPSTDMLRRKAPIFGTRLPWRVALSTKDSCDFIVGFKIQDVLFCT